MTKWFLLKTDQKKVSCMHPWTETFQPYEHVKRTIYKVSRKANRNPRVGYQISNGPGPRPWTRPAPYFRRTITSYPRTSIFPTPTPASIAASPEAAINNLNSETKKSPQAMSYINIEPTEGYEESVNENTDEQGKDEEAWNKYATDEEDDFKLK